jgi:hypothetical protein
MERTAAPILFADSQLDEARHVCAFFKGNDEAHPVLLPSLKRWVLPYDWPPWSGSQNRRFGNWPVEMPRIPAKSCQKLV